MTQFTTFGYVFESMAVRDLRVYAEVLDGTVYHYLDSNGLECDAVITLRDGRCGLVEMKLYDADGVEQGAANLRRLAGLMNTEKMEPPSFLAVITGGEVAYRRDDGVDVIPLGVLRP